MTNQGLLPCPLCKSAGRLPNDDANRVCCSSNICGLYAAHLRFSVWQALPRSSEDAVQNIEQLQARIGHLRFAAKGGTALRDTADLLTFMADRFVAQYRENESTDWVRAAYERARMLRSALADTIEEEQTDD